MSFKSDKKLAYTFLISILAVTFYIAIHSFVVQSPMFLVDDRTEYIYVNVKTFKQLILGTDAFGLFRPIKNLFFFLFFKVFSDLMWARMLAIGIGIASFFAARHLFNHIFKNIFYATLAASIWLLAPTLVSSVAWLSCLNIQLMCLLATATIGCYDCGTRKAYIGAGFLLFLAQLSYEQAVIVGPLLFVFDFFLRPERLKRKSTWLIYVAYAGITLIYLILRQVIGGKLQMAGVFDNIDRLQLIVAAPYFTFSHFWTWFYPFGRFTVFGDYTPGDVSSLSLSLYWLLFLAWPCFSWILRRRLPVVAWALATAWVAFLPVGNIAGLGNGPYGDYYLGLSALGFSVLIVAIVKESFVLPSIWRKGLMFVGVAFLISRVATLTETFKWADYWSNGLKAYEVSVKNFPTYIGNQIKLARLYADGGQPEQVFEMARNIENLIKPDSVYLAKWYLVKVVASLNLRRNAGETMGYLEQMKESSHSDDLGYYHYLRGCVFEDLKEDEESALAEYRLALKDNVLQEDCQDAANRYARLMAMRGDYAEAKRWLEMILTMSPDDEVAKHNLEVLELKLSEAKLLPLSQPSLIDSSVSP